MDSHNVNGSTNAHHASHHHSIHSAQRHFPTSLHLGGQVSIDPLASSDDLHAWSLFRQNLNANFSESALHLSGVHHNATVASTTPTTTITAARASPPHYNSTARGGDAFEKLTEPAGQRPPLSMERDNGSGGGGANFPLHESTLNNIFSHPKYGAQLKNQDAFTYLRFGLPRVKTTLANSGENNTETTIKTENLFSVADHQPPNRSRNFYKSPNQDHRPAANVQLNEELKRRFWNSDTNLFRADFDNSGNSDSSGKEMLPPENMNQFFQHPNSSSSPEKRPQQNASRPVRSHKIKPTYSVNDLRYKGRGHLDKFESEYSSDPAARFRSPVSHTPFPQNHSHHYHHQQQQQQQHEMAGDNGGRGFLSLDEEIRLDEMLPNGDMNCEMSTFGPANSNLPPPLAKHPHLVVKDLQYEVDKSPVWRRLCGFSRQKLRVLEDISFDVRGGELFACMATSADQGTALLEVLANRHDHRHGTIRAELYLNGVTVTPRQLSRVTAYVQQTMHFSPDMSARQALLFAGLMIGPVVRGTVGSTDIKRRTRTILEELNLDAQRHTRLSELTDSERKRLHIAIHLLLDTELLILDQPLEGLDIFDAFFLVEYLRQWASIGGRLVIMTISPPTYEVFTMLNRVLLLSAGRSLYVGPRADFTKYFTSLDFPCPPFKNPSDYYIDLVTMDDLSQEALIESSQRVENLSEIHMRRPLAELFSTMPGPPAVMPPPFRRANLAMQFLALWIRALIFCFPYNVVHLFNRFLTAVILSLLIGAIFWQVRAGREQEYVWDRIGFIGTMLGVGLLPLLLGELSNAYREKQHILCEIQQGFYSLPAYIFAKMLYSAPQSMLIGLAYALPACSMAGLQMHTGPNSLPYYLLVMLSYFYALRLFVIALVWCCRRKSTATWIFGVLFVIFILSSGTSIQLRDIAFTHRWLRALSPIRWVHEALIAWEFEPNAIFSITTDGASSFVSSFLCSRNPVIQQPNAILVRADCGFQTRANVLKWFDYQGSSSANLRPWWHSLLSLLILYIVSFIIGSILFYIHAYYYRDDKPKNGKK